MEKLDLIKKLDEEFSIYKYHDIWNIFDEYTKNIEQYMQPRYKEHACGLMIDFTDNIKEVLTTTFITDNIFKYIKESNKKDVLIFTHHPYYQKEIDYSWHDAISDNLDIIKDNRIAIYVCHIALDFHPKYSTALYLSKELIAKIDGRISYKFDGIEGKVVGECYGNCVENLFDKISKISSRVSFYQFGEKQPQKICCSPGGGNVIEIIRMAKEKGVDTYITGVSEFKGRNSISRNKVFFTELEDMGINIIGLGHYESEFLAMKGLVKDYFAHLIEKVSYFEDKYYL